MPQTHHEIFLGRQPILDRRQSIVAFELLFRSGENNSADILDDLQASASVINYAFSDLGMGSALGKGKCFINVSKKLLMSGMIELLPKERVVLELLESIEPDDALMERSRQLRSQGFSLALDDFASGARHEALMEVVDLVKVDLIRASEQDLSELVRYLKRWRVKLLAEKVETQEDVNRCMELGFDYFQGYYFARPHMIIGKRVDPSKMAALDLLGLILAEAETDEIEQAFKRSPSLSYNLLRLINSVAGGLPRKVSSLNQAIIALGRRQLLRWLQLLLFADQQKEGGGGPLLQLAAIRGRMLELLAQSAAPSDKEYQDRAFMSGILSLLACCWESRCRKSSARSIWGPMSRKPC